mmetsp:Transcript_7376/g.10841  ORF Transcript_7376/g.10841 Transcript_7376/m.10841 type:complete len:96 (-) Transcript_7376:1955-2242(-)
MVDGAGDRRLDQCLLGNSRLGSNQELMLLAVTVTSIQTFSLNRIGARSDGVDEEDHFRPVLDRSPRRQRQNHRQKAVLYIELHTVKCTETKVEMA